MERRIQEVLDGERSRRELTPAERSRLDEYERAIRGALDPLAREAGVDVTSAVMSRIGARRPSAAGDPRPETVDAGSDRGGVPDLLRRTWEWLWRPRDVRLRPAWGLAALLAALLLPAVPLWDGPPAGSGPAVAGPAAAGEARTVLVQFRLDAPEARSVRLAGDFSEWQPTHALHEVAPGVWSVVVPLEPGVHDYAFVVDGRQWRVDPLAPAVDDGFGGRNSRLALMAPGTAPEPAGTS